MITRILLTGLAILLSLLSIAQEQLYFAQQFHGSEEQVAAIFSNQLSLKGGEAYVFHLRPMGCPRCEGLINPLISLIKKKDPDAQVVLATSYPRKNATLAYVKARNYHIDFLYLDTLDLLYNSFQFSSNNLNVPYLHKIDLQTGDVLYTTALLGITVNKELADKIMTSNTPAPKIERPKALKNLPAQKSSTPEISGQLKFKKAVPLEENKSFPVSSPISLSVLNEGKEFCFIDDLSASVYIYGIDGTFQAGLPPTEAEERVFKNSNVSEEIFLFLKKSNILNTIYLNTVDSKSNQVRIVSSLPKVEIEPDSSVGYSNQIAFVSKNRNNEIIEIDTIENYPGGEFVLSHSKTVFLPDFIAIPLLRGWPASGTTAFGEREPSENPFLSGFYDHCPIFALYDYNGNFLSNIGTIPTLFRNLKTGYFFNAPKIAQHGNNLYVSFGYSGEILRYSTANLSENNLPIDTITAFQNTHFLNMGNYSGEAEVYDESGSSRVYFGEGYFQNNQPATGEELNYLKSLTPLLRKQIVEMKVAENELAVLIRENGQYSIAIFDNDGNELYVGSIQSNHAEFGTMLRCRLLHNAVEDRFELISIFDGGSRLYLAQLSLEGYMN